MRRMTIRALVVLSCLLASAFAQEAPKVVSLDPPEGAEVDAKVQTKLVVVFDRAMEQSSYSLCGGGPTFPTARSKPKWISDTTLEFEVELAPDREYRIGLNCQGSANTKSKDGVPLIARSWTFTTMPGALRPETEQRQRNQLAFDLLFEALQQRYSHRDVRVKDWEGLKEAAAKSALAARTDRAFASAVAKALAPTQDLHLWFTVNGSTIGVTSREVDALFRPQLLPRYVKSEKIDNATLYGRTDDGIGYLVIASWQKPVDPQRIGAAITELMDCKAMVVDVRLNSGGDERLAQQVAAWFVRGEKVYGRHHVRDGAGKDGFGPVQERSLTGRDDGFEGPVAVLTSRCVMSSCESFVQMMRQANDCTVVGQPTYGSSGNPQPVDLQNGVTAMVPSWQDLRLDGTPIEGEGLLPDVLVACAPKDFETADPILEKALAVLREKVAAAK